MNATAKKAREIFIEAVGKAAPDQWDNFLADACSGDDALFARVKELLKAHAEADSLLERPAPGLAATIDEPIAEGLGTRIGPYKLLEQIGEGGFGVVFMAEQTEPVRRKVALKVLKPGMDTRQVIARFEAERQALAIMDHSNIAKVFDGGVTVSGRPYFVMELVKGVPVTEYCDQNHLTPRQRLELFLSVCQAVQHAHQKGIIHRDLKPSNVLVSRHDTTPIVKVIDFGVAKALGQELTDKTLFTAMAQMIGTPLYMSPEQAGMSDLDIDTRSDIYSLGVLLYELLTGTTPFTKERFKQAAYDEIRRIIREEEPAKPSTRVSTLGQASTEISTQRKSEPKRLSQLYRGELDWIVMKALEKDRTRRYETASSFAADVQRYLDDEAVLACPPSASYRLGKFLKRNKGPVLAASLVLAVLVSGVIGTSWGLVRAERAWAAETERAEGERQAKEQALAAEKLAAERLTQVEAEQKRTLEQKQLAEDNAKNAQEEKRIADAVRDFLQKLLIQPNVAFLRPKEVWATGQGNRNVTVREVLDRAAAELAPEKIEANFPGQPLVQAQLLRVLGQTYIGIGNYRAAVAFLQREAALRQRHLGLDHPQTLSTLSNLAVAYGAAGMVSEAVRLDEQLHDHRLKKLGPDHPDTLSALYSLGGAYLAAGKLPEAIRAFEQVRDAVEKKRGPNDLYTLGAILSLASAYRNAGKLPEAVQLFERARNGYEKKFGPNHMLTLVAVNGLAVAYADGGRKLPEAIRMLEQVRDAGEKRLGPDHPNTLHTLADLASAYRLAKQLGKSIPLLEDVLKRSEANLGRDHPSTLRTMANLGVNYFDAGRLDEAIPLLEEAHRKAQPHAVLFFVGDRLATAYIKAGRAIEASRLIEEQLAAARRQFQPDNSQLADALTSSGKNQLDLKQYAAAELLLGECLTLWEKLAELKQASPWQVASAKSLLGAALLGQKKYAEAEPLLLAGYDGLKQDEKSIPAKGWSNIADALDRLIELSDATDKKDDAAKWRKELEALRAAELKIEKK